MIFAAGYGTRMQPLTHALPKALLPFQNKPIIAHIIKQLPPIDELVVNTHHLSRHIEDYFNARTFPFTVTLLHEPKILGTGGGLQNARASLCNDDFLLLNCDILCDANFREIVSFDAKSATDVVLFCNNRAESSRLLFDATGQLCGRLVGNVRHMLGNDDDVRDMAFCGISYFTKTGSRFFFETGYSEPSIVDSWLNMAKRKRSVRLGDISGSRWIDLGTAEKYNRAQNLRHI